MAALRSSREGASERAERANFERGLKKVLSVSHSEMQARLAAAKQDRQQRGKRASDRVSRAKD